MKTLLVITSFILLGVALPIKNGTIKVVNNASATLAHEHIATQQVVTSYAWQAAPPVTPIEERKSTNWLWWVVGVGLAVGGGVLLYFLIKKDPRHDVR